MAIEQSQSFNKILGSRKVCVINLDEKEYKEDFKGEIITIPPNGVRKVFMPFWKATKFKSSCIAPPMQDMTGDAIKGGMVKMIKVVELIESERHELGELTPEDIQKQVIQAEAKKTLTCVECGFEAKNAPGLVLHNSAKHAGSHDSVAV